MMFSGLPGNYHFYAHSDTWAPTLLCLEEILIRSFFQPVMKEKWQKNKGIMGSFGRVSLIAKPLPTSEGTEVDYNKVFGDQ